MTTIDTQIQQLINHLSKLDNKNIDFQAWLDSGLEYITDIFGFISTQRSNFDGIKSDFKISIITINDQHKCAQNLTAF
jgi:hypothetical protein